MFDNPMKCLKTLNGHEHSVSFLVFSPDGNNLYSASRDKTIKLWEVNSGFCKSTFKGHDEWVRSLSINNKGDMIASCSDDETVIVWSDKGELKNQFKCHENVIEHVLFVNDENSKKEIYYGEFNSHGEDKLQEI